MKPISFYPHEATILTEVAKRHDIKPARHLFVEARKRGGKHFVIEEHTGIGPSSTTSRIYPPAKGIKFATYSEGVLWIKLHRLAGAWGLS